MIQFKLNGHWVESNYQANMRLIDVLRDEFQLTGAKEGCGEGECGACTVLIGGKLVNSCLVLVGTLEGSEILTIEGYSKTDRYKCLSESYAKAGAVQCGFCTPGMMMASEALLLENAHPNEREIRASISGNLCRCTGYNMIVDAIKIAADEGDGLW